MIVLGADPLTQFLNRSAATPFCWGQMDCLLWLADWIFERRGIDPAANYRGTYSTMLGAARIVADAGGIVELVDTQATVAGLSRVTPGARGDIAVVAVGGEGGANFGYGAGGIIVGGTVALISQAGLIAPRTSDIQMLAAWKV